LEFSYFIQDFFVAKVNIPTEDKFNKRENIIYSAYIYNYLQKLGTGPALSFDLPSPQS
jgi:hypothetical protein